MIVLGIDWGEAKVGIAISAGSLAEPVTVLPTDTSISEILKLVLENKVEKIIVGISENESEKKARDFGKKLEEVVVIPVEFADETLSTYEAQYLAIEAGVPQKKRKLKEDAFAATLILQRYLDELSP